MVPPEWATTQESPTGQGLHRREDAATDLIQTMKAEDASDADIEAKQRALNKAYDQYVKRHGLIGTAKSDFLSNDTEFPVAMSLETPVTTIKDTVVKTGPKKGHVRQMSVTEFKKADIFTTRTVFPFVEPKTASSLDDAINLSLTYRNKVDVDYIAELTGVDPKKARRT